MTPAELRRRLAALPDAAQGEIAAALDEIAADVAAEAGRTLGAPPADPSGRLGVAITAGRGPDGGAAVRVDAPFAADLEYGTRRMAARPFLRPAVAAVAGSARRRMADALAYVVGRGLGESS